MGEEAAQSFKSLCIEVWQSVQLLANSACDFEKVVVDDALGYAAAAHQHAVIAQDQERAAVEVPHQFRVMSLSNSNPSNS